ncbi:hypothetical protein [Olleya sp. HaHaR_3_96]|uniref:hypothetical protein n=1 Tax=Olleya sp. HaHaR_3_96 TaxID=2745560 RepID=UPI001C4F4AB7|nr:hypothetical protein [Olleya sp. HaHaR_3_96]QXP59324.1 hypothetical protein H0I26_15570 [Olleya sp. HaHaR_3_96]
MKKVTVTLCIISLILQSCISQSNFDLSDITLNENIKDLPIEKLDLYEKDFFLSSEYSGHTIYDKQFLNFKGVALEGRIHPNTNYLRNSVSFWFSKKDNIISILEINIHTHDECTEFVNVLIKKLGNPNYIRFENKKERERDNPSNYLWEDTVNNRTYFLDVYKDYQTKKYEKAHLYMLKNSDTIVYPTMFDFPEYGYYGEFIDERSKKQDPTYTYQQYVADKVKRGRGEYENYYTK